jgi:hypothetical protein
MTERFDRREIIRGAALGAASLAACKAAGQVFAPGIAPGLMLPQNAPQTTTLSLPYSFTQGSLPPALTFSRAGPAWQLQPGGVFGQVAPNVPRLDYKSDGTVRGLLVEPVSTNFMPSSFGAAALSAGPVAFTNAQNGNVNSNPGAIGPDGATQSVRVLLNNANNNPYRGPTQNISTYGANAYNAGLADKIFWVVAKQWTGSSTACPYLYFGATITPGNYGSGYYAIGVMDLTQTGTSGSLNTTFTAGSTWTLNSSGWVNLGGGWLMGWINCSQTSSQNFAGVAACPVPTIPATPTTSFGVGSSSSYLSGADIWAMGVEIVPRNPGFTSNGYVSVSSLNPNTASSGGVVRQPDLAFLNLPAGTQGLQLTFDDASTASIGVSPVGSPNGSIIAPTNPTVQIPTQISAGRRIASIAATTLSSPFPVWDESDTLGGTLAANYGDIDDVGAHMLLIYAATQGWITLIGANSTSTDINSAKFIHACYRHAGFGHVPVGQYNGGDMYGPASGVSYTAATLAYNNGQWADPNFVAPDATANLIAGCIACYNTFGPNTLTSVSHGQLVNIANVILAPASQVNFKGWTGAQLLANTLKYVVIMGGYSNQTPPAYSSNYEYNFYCNNIPAYTQAALSTTSGLQSPAFIAAGVQIYGLDWTMGNNSSWFSTAANMTKYLDLTAGSSPWVYAMNAYQSGFTYRAGWDVTAALMVLQLAGVPAVSGSNAIFTTSNGVGSAQPAWVGTCNVNSAGKNNLVSGAGNYTFCGTNSYSAVQAGITAFSSKVW